MASDRFLSCMVRLLAVGALFASCSAFAIDQTDPPVSSGFKFEEKTGESLYRGSCQACHMAQGEGASSGAAAFPALRANPKLAAAAYPIYNVLHGRHGMPAFGAEMSDTQIADVVNYVRTHFDNHYTDNATAQDVKRLR